MSEIPIGPAEISPIRVVDLWTNAVRTFVPALVAAGLTWAGERWHIVLPSELSAQTAVWAVVAVLAVYNMVAKALEHATGPGRVGRFARWLGRWMHGGVVRVPVYVKPEEAARLARVLLSARRSGR